MKVDLFRHRIAGQPTRDYCSAVTPSPIERRWTRSDLRIALADLGEAGVPPDAGVIVIEGDLIAQWLEVVDGG